MAQTDTTVQEIPAEVLERILINTVVLEVRGMKLVKSVWGTKVDVVISKLSEVCEQWNAVVSTEFFHRQVLQILDNSDVGVIRIEVLAQYLHPFYSYKVASWRNNLALLCPPDSDGKVIKVYDRNNMAVLRKKFALPQRNPFDMVACDISDCLYVVCDEPSGSMVLRIGIDHRYKCKISPFIVKIRPEVSRMSVTGAGRLLLSSVKDGNDLACVCTYDLNGVFLHKMVLPNNLYMMSGDKVVEKLNGNRLMFSSNSQGLAELTELDPNGRLVRQSQSGLSFQCCGDFADIHDRIVLYEVGGQVELYDAELNTLDFVLPPVNVPNLHFMSFDRGLNQLVGVHSLHSSGTLITLLQIRETRN